MKWSPKHDRFIVDREIRKQRKDKWLREFDVILLVMSVVGFIGFFLFFWGLFFK